MKATNPLAVMRLVEAYVDARVFAAHGREKPGLIDATREDVETALLALGVNAGPQRIALSANDVLVVKLDGKFASREQRVAFRDALNDAAGCSRVVVLEAGMSLAGVLGVVSSLEEPADA